MFDGSEYSGISRSSSNVSLAQQDRIDINSGSDIFAGDQFFAPQDRLCASTTFGKPPQALPPSRSTSMLSSIVNVAAVCLSSGSLLSMPWGFASAGIVAACFVTLLTMAMSVVSLVVLLKAADRRAAGTYNELVIFAYGRELGYLCEYLLLLFLWSLCLLYMSLVGDCFGPVLQSLFPEGYISLPTARSESMVALTLVFSLPLCMLKRTRHLAYSSAISVLLACIVVGYILAVGTHRAVLGSVSFASMPWLWHNNPSFINIFPPTVLAFNCHALVNPIYMELKTHSVPAMGRVIACGYGLTLFLYLMAAGFGILWFGDGQTPRILIASATVLSSAALCATGFTALLCLPLWLFSARLVVRSLFFENRDFSRPQFYGLTVIIFSTTLCLAAFVPYMGLVCRVLVQVLSLPIVYVFPAALMWTEFESGHANKVAACMFGTVGVALTASALCGQVLEIT